MRLIAVIILFITGACANTSTTLEPAYLKLTEASPNDRELLIVILTGTQNLIDSGEEPNIIPLEIRLSLQEYNVLTIQNDDTVDHQVGPFYIRSGEKLTQRFTRPLIYEGACSLHPGEGSTVKIIVEE